LKYENKSKKKKKKKNCGIRSPDKRRINEPSELRSRAERFAEKSKTQTGLGNNKNRFFGCYCGDFNIRLERGLRETINDEIIILMRVQT